MKHILIPLLISLAIASGCSKPTPGQHRDYSAFNRQGVNAAKQFVKQSKGQSELQTIDLLLNVRATHTDILQTNGQEAADAFAKGFETYISQHNDSLYSTIVASSPSANTPQ